MTTNAMEMLKKSMVCLVAGLAVSGAVWAQNTDAPPDPFVKGNRPGATVTGDPNPFAPAVDKEAELLDERMQQLVIPEVDFKQASLDNAITYLQAVARELDPKHRGVNMVVKSEPDIIPETITFSAQEISLRDALRTIAKLAGCRYWIENNMVMIGREPASAGQGKTWIEVEALFVAFPLKDVETLARTGKLNERALTNLWSKGGGRLLAAPRVVTRSGVEAMVRSVTEQLYPASFEAACVGTAESAAARAGAGEQGEAASTNASAPAGSPRLSQSVPFLVPGDFEMRECGAILRTLPEATAGSDDIHLILNPSVTELSGWRPAVTATCGDSKSPYTVTAGELPVFHTCDASVQTVVPNGRQVLIGGGTSSPDGTELVYIFVTARRWADAP